MSKESIQSDRLPRHIAIIMDGNGRWAKKHGLARMLGHQQGVQAVHRVTEAAAELGIEYLTLYTFSVENWNRPKAEVDALMTLLVDTIIRETPTLMKNNVRLLTIGDTEQLPADAKQRFVQCMQQTAGNTGLNLVIALSYSARWEITQAAKAIARDVEKGACDPNTINEDVFRRYLTTAAMPDPDLLIRTSGELRISNFLLYQIAYSEFYFTDTLWPDFTEEDFYNAIIDYQGRERRFGKTSEQIH